MLHPISATSFIRTILMLTCLYYVIIGIRYFPNEIRALIRRCRAKFILLLPATMGLVISASAQTADGNAGITQANQLVRTYYQTGISLMYAISGIIGLIGAIKVFSLWNGGHRDEIGKAAAAWFGSCVFIVVVATVLQSFFGL
jgi:hypothetical protein